MRKICLFLCFYLISLVQISAQKISPFSVNVGGSTNITLDYSIGESSSISYFQGPNPISLSTGIIQSFTPLVTGIVNRVFEEGEGLALSPNPATDFVQLKGALTKPGFAEFHLIDQQGRILYTIPTTYYINFLEKEINISHLQGGTYFIRLIFLSSDHLKQALTFKFIKIN
jgi:hypothetical protein